MMAGLHRKLLNMGVSAVIVAAALFPIAWGLGTSVKPTPDILAYPPQMIPETVSLEHYQRLLREGVASSIANSVAVTAATILMCLTIGFVAAYAMARARFPGKTLVLVLIVSVMSIPIASLIVPTFSLLTFLGLLDSRTGLVCLYAAYQLPIVIWMLMGYIQSVPVELEQAAMIDGYSRFGAMRKIVLPLSRPALVAAGLFVLTFAWNDFVVAVAMTTSLETRTFPVAVYNFLGFFGREWGPLLAASMISIVPIVVVFAVFQRHFVSGMTGGSVKG